MKVFRIEFVSGDPETITPVLLASPVCAQLKAVSHLSVI